MKHRLTYRMKQGGAHWTLTVWVNGGCAGHLCVRDEEVDVLHLLTKALGREGAWQQGVGFAEKAEVR